MIRVVLYNNSTSIQVADVSRLSDKGDVLLTSEVKPMTKLVKYKPSLKEFLFGLDLAISVTYPESGGKTKFIVG